MHLGVEIFSCIFLFSTSLLTLSKHRDENVHKRPQQMKVIAEHVKPSSTQFRKTQQEALVEDGVCPSTKTTRPINSNM